MTAPANLDGMYRQVRSRCPNAGVSWFLMASLTYYWADQPILTDGCFDGICQDLRQRWDEIEHPHKGLIDRGMLDAGTGFSLEPALYPWMLRSAARRLLEGAPFHSTLPAWLCGPMPIRPDGAVPTRPAAAAPELSAPPAPPPLDLNWVLPIPPAATERPTQISLF